MKRKLVSRLDSVEDKEIIITEMNNTVLQPIPVNSTTGIINDIMRKSDITEEDIIYNKLLRNEKLNNTEVLDKVKQIFMIPSLDMMNTEMVAAYFNVGTEAIKSMIKDKNKGGELIENGLKLYSRNEMFDMVESLGMSCENLPKLNSVKGGYYIGNIKFNNRPQYLFNRRVILNIAMLLQESEVAKAIRRCLLDVSESPIVKSVIINNIEYSKNGKGTFKNGLYDQFRNPAPMQPQVTLEDIYKQNNYIIDLINKLMR